MLCMYVLKESVNDGKGIEERDIFSTESRV